MSRTVDASQPDFYENQRVVRLDLEDEPAVGSGDAVDLEGAQLELERQRIAAREGCALTSRCSRPASPAAERHVVSQEFPDAQPVKWLVSAQRGARRCN